MMAFARLELVKGRLLVAGLMGAFGASLPLAAWAFARWRGNPAQGVEAALLFWCVLGLPLCSLLIGASSGAAHRSALAASAEAPLPLSAGRRLGESLLAALLQAIALAVVVVATAAALSPKVRAILDLAEVFTSGHGLKGLLAVAAAFACLYGLAASFLCAYGLGHGIAGGVVAGIITAPVVGSLAWGLTLENMSGPRAPYTATAAAVCAASGAGLYLAFSRLPPWLERRSGRAWTAFACAAVGLALGLLAARVGQGRFNRVVFFGQFFIRETGQLSWEAAAPVLAASPEARRAAGAGALTSSQSGALMHWRPDGTRRTLIPGRTIKRKSDIKIFDNLPWINAVSWDAGGGLWVLRTSPGERHGEKLLEVWAGSVNGLELKGRRPSDGGWMRMAWKGREPVVVVLDSPGSHRVASLSGRGPLVWEPVKGSVDEFLLGESAAAGLAGRVAPGGRVLRAGRKEWTLPGSAQPGQRVLGLRFGPDLLFPVRVKTASGNALALCGPRGVRAVWAGREVWHSLHRAADGSFWGRRDKRSWHILAPDGSVLEPFDTGPSGAAAGEAEFLRTDGRSVWFVAGRDLVRAKAADGSVEKRWRLPGGWKMERSMERSEELRYWGSAEGLFWHTGRRMLFFDWEGRRRDLGLVWR